MPHVVAAGPEVVFIASGGGQRDLGRKRHHIFRYYRQKAGSNCAGWRDGGDSVTKGSIANGRSSPENRRQDRPKIQGNYRAERRVEKRPVFDRARRAD